MIIGSTRSSITLKTTANEVVTFLGEWVPNEGFWLCKQDIYEGIYNVLKNNIKIPKSKESYYLKELQLAADENNWKLLVE